MRPHTGWGFGKRDRGKDTQTQRQKRKFSGVLLHGDTKLLNESSTLRAHLTWMGFAGGSDGNDLPTMGGTGFYPWVWKIPWRRELQDYTYSHIKESPGPISTEAERVCNGEVSFHSSWQILSWTLNHVRCSPTSTIPMNREEKACSNKARPTIC